MNEKIHDLLNRVEEQTGQKMPEYYVCAADASLEITVVGQPQQNLFGVVGKLLGQAGQLNTSLLHGYRCLITFGDENKCFIQSETGEYAETTENTLFEALMAFGNTGEPLHCAMQINHPLLEEMTIRLVASDDDFDDVDASDVATTCDFCFMTLNASAVLSMSERKILRRGLMEKLGEQLGILLVNTSKVDPEGLRDVEDLLDGFLKEQHTVYDLDLNPEELLAELGRIKEEKAGLHAKRDDRAYRQCVKTALTEVRKTIALMEEDGDRLGDAIALLKEKAKELPKRQEAASRRCRMKYLSSMKVEYNDLLAKQNQMIQDALAEEIDRGEDVQKMASIIPGYLKNEWNRASEQVFDLLEKAGKEMEAYLSEYIENDVVEFLGENGNTETASYIIRLMTSVYPVQCFQGIAGNLSFDEAKDYSSLKKGGTIAAGIGLALFGHPLIGAGLAIYGAAKVGKQAAALTQATNKQALKEAGEDLCAENYAGAVEWLDGVFVQLNESVNACVNESYRRLMEGMLAVIRARQTDSEAKEQHLAVLKALEAELVSAV